MRLKIEFIVFILYVSLSFAQEKFVFEEVQGGPENILISSIVQDSKGFIWIATQDGLYRYDGYKFELFRNDPGNPQSIAANWVMDMTIDSNQNYWLGTFGRGVTKFCPKDMTFINFSMDSPNYFDGNLVSKIESIDKDHIICASDKGYKILNIHTNKVENLGVGGYNDPLTISQDIIWLVGNKNELYTYHIEDKYLQHEFTFDSPIELLEYIPGKGLLVGLTNALVLFNDGSIKKRLPILEWYRKITMDAKGRYWLQNKSVITQLDTENFTLKPLDIDKKILEKSIGTIFFDKQQNFWIGTEAGLFKEKKYHSAFKTKNLNIHARRIIKYDSTLYVGGTRGLFKITKEDSITQLTDKPVVSLLVEQDNIYFGSYEPEVYKLNKGSIKEISVPSKTKRLPIFGMVRDRNKRLWVGSWRGIAVYNGYDELLKYIRFTPKSENGESKTIKLYIDSKDRLWIITAAYGVFRIDNISTINVDEVATQIKNYKYEKDNLKSLTSNIVLSIDEDLDGNLWFGSDPGIFKYQEDTDDFERIQYRGKLFDKKVMTIRTDNKQNLWITTINDGIYVYHTGKKSMQHFTEGDGLVSNAFLYGSGYYDSLQQQLYFGTNEGVQEINLEKFILKKTTHIPKISEFKVQSTSGEELFHASQAPFLKQVSLKSQENDFSIRFSALDFSHPEKVHYNYTLNNDIWKTTDLQTAYFTNVPHGNHLLKVKALYSASSSDEFITEFKISIAPPWYLNIWSKLVYVLLFFSASLLIYKYLKWRWSMKLQVQLKEAETNRLKKLDEFKTKLYTNISHEFRTPLTLISGPIDHQLSKDTLKKEDRKVLKLVKQNANRLLNLVNQMVDLSLIDSGQLRLQVTQGNLNILLKQIVEAFQYKAKEKQIEIKSSIQNLEYVWYDIDCIEKIVTNLISNAIKYSPENSKIIIDAKAVDNTLVLSVINTNINISKKDFEKLFQRFYQNNEASEGVGVGLALVKELVNLSKGNIITNILNEDKVQFTVSLPIHKSAFKFNEIKKYLVNKTAIDTTPLIKTIDKDKPILLIVEDNNDIRAFIVSIFKNTYKIIEANNGTIGIELALQYIPDIIISDIMMPVKDGIALCNTLKYNTLTSHIPIILLTAKVGEEHEIEGLKTGADAYITKPFGSEKLQLRVKKLIENRQQLQKHFSKGFTINPELSITSTEADFLKHLKFILDKNITNSNFSSNMLSSAMKMSRAQLHRKLKAILGMSTSEFIRTQRLKLALSLLENSDATVSEIAYQIGFNTPSYFIKCFKDIYKCTPSEYLSK